MTDKQAQTPKKKSYDLPAADQVMEELSKAESMDDFFGKEGIFANLFAKTLEQMLEAELSEELGYEKYEAKGRNSGNSRNGSYPKKVRSSGGGDVKVRVPRDRNGEFEPKIVPKYGANTNELEEKILGLYAKGVSTRDIQDTMAELYGIELSPTTISTITDKVVAAVQSWQNRPLAVVYPIIFLDAIHLKIRRDGKVKNRAVHIVMGIDLEGHKDILGHWLAEGGEGANFWLSVISDLQNRGVQDIFIAAMDGLAGFSDALQAVFPQTQVQRCIVHQIRASLKYVSWNDRRIFMKDLRRVYQAPNRETAETNLLQLAEHWSEKYPIAIRSWHNHWEELATFFDYPAEIRRLIYTTNPIEGYNRQLRKVTKTKASFPTEQAALKLLFLANVHITKKWTRPIPNWPLILNQLAIRFAGRLPL